MNIERIPAEQESQFAELVRIYEASLPTSERKTIAALQAMLARPEYAFLAASQAGRVIAFAIAIALPETDAALLEYMGVDPELRGKGIGATLFRTVAAQLEIADRFLLIEVDSDREHSADQQQRARRKSFYRRLGARELDGLRYIMPPVARAAPPPMHLLAYHRELPACIAKERVRPWLEACYAQVYDVPAGDPRVRSMLAGCPDCIPLV